METIKEIWMFLRVRKKMWLAPVIVALLILGLLITIAGHGGAVGAFIYAF